MNNEPTPMHTAMPELDVEHIALDDSTDVLTELVSRATGSDASATARLMTALQSHGLSPATIFLNFFEPAARRLGDLWQDDLCSEFDITVALCRLQSLTRQLGESSHVPVAHPAKRRSVLVATQPGETHMLALGLSSESFWRAGWDVSCAFPQDDGELAQLVSSQRFDVLDLSLSSVFRRDHRLAAMGRSIRGARASSANPSLVVLATGRIFFEHPEFSVLVGADAASKAAARTASLADLLIDALSSSPFSRTQGTLLNMGERVAAKAFRSALRLAA